MYRQEMADLILDRISEEKGTIRHMYEKSCDHIGYFYLDNLLPDDVARQIHDAFPAPGSMKLRKSLREHKHVAAQMDQHDPIIEEAVYAFQDQRIVELIREVCGIESLYPDENLYAGGISLMGKGQFLNPHLDNSHEKDRARWRVLNLLYYVSPDWKGRSGGHLELWPDGVKGKPLTMESAFNRLVVMATHGSSWHSVSPVLEDRNRTCISNYYFSDSPLKASDRFHVTSFRGRPEQKIRDIVLRADIRLRQGIRKIFPKGAVKTDHLYRK
ncbi:MAG: 2OG-Fe(II) oxygenase [Pseudomonadota bacterium]